MGRHVCGVLADPWLCGWACLRGAGYSGLCWCARERQVGWLFVLLYEWSCVSGAGYSQLREWACVKHTGPRPLGSPTRWHLLCGPLGPRRRDRPPTPPDWVPPLHPPATLRTRGACSLLAQPHCYCSTVRVVGGPTLPWSAW